MSTILAEIKAAFDTSYENYKNSSKSDKLLEASKLIAAANLQFQNNLVSTLEPIFIKGDEFCRTDSNVIHNFDS